MIKLFNKNDKTQYIWLLDFIMQEEDFDFYYTEKNSRYYLTDIYSLKKLFENSDKIFTLEKNGDYVGIIMSWKSLGGNIERHYVKIKAKNIDVADKLLTVLVWNTERDLFVKLRKNSKFLSVFKQKGFKFVGGRGIQFLLKRKKDIFIKKELKANKNDSIRHTTNSQEINRR